MAQHPHTLLAHAGRPDEATLAPVNPPLVRASTVLFPDCAALKAGAGQRASYGRHGNATVWALEEALCAAEGADACLLTPSGLSAISMALLGLLSPGDHLLMTDAAYEPTRAFCDGMLAEMGVETSYYDPEIGGGIAALLRPNTRVVFVESPGSLTFEVQDVPAIAAAAHAHGALLVADSTWATPLGWDAFALGVDVSLHSLTKYVGGHSDLLMGALLCRAELEPRLRRRYRQLGLAVGSDDAALALRGLRTLAARLAMHRQHAMQVALWLRRQPEVESVLYPPLEGAPGHELWRRDFHPDYGCGLMGALFRPGVSVERVNALVDATRLFGIGYSWGGYESLILPVRPEGARSATRPAWAGRVLARLHVGLESPDDLIADLEAGFAALRAAGR